MKIAIIVIVVLLGLSVIGSKLLPKGATTLPDNPFLVDVRTAQEFAGGSVQGATNIPLSTVHDSIHLLEDKGNIVVFCRSGNRSGKAKHILESKGVKAVTNGGSLQNVRDLLQK